MITSQPSTDARQASAGRSRFGVKTRLLYAFGAMLLLTLAVGAVGWWGIGNIQQALNTLQRQSIPEITRSMALMEQSARLVAQAPFVANAKILVHLETESQHLRERLDAFQQLVSQLHDRPSAAPAIASQSAAASGERDLDELAQRISKALLDLVEVTRRGIFLDARMRDRQYRLQQLYRELEHRIEAVVAGTQPAPRTENPLTSLLGETHRIAGTLQAAATVESINDLQTLETRYRQGVQAARQTLPALDQGYESIVATFDKLVATGAGEDGLFELRRQQLANGDERAYLLTASNVLSAGLNDQVARLTERIKQTTEQRSLDAAAVLADSQVRIFVLGAICLLAALVSASYVVRDLGGNLGAVTQSMRQLAGGDRTGSIPATDRKDEIGDLARAFDVFRRSMIRLDETSQQLSDNNRLLEAVIRNMNDGLSVFDAEGRLVAWNPQFRDLYRISDEAMSTLTTLRGDVEHFLTREGVTIRRLDGRLLAPEEVFSDHRQQIEIYLPDERLLEVRTSPMPEGGIVITHTDLTERKSIEAQLRQAQKMESVGQLTGGLAHDFNNLLSTIIGNLSLLQEKLDAQPALREKALRALEAADRGALITQRLLAFSRKQALRPQAVAVNDLIEGMLDLLTFSVGDDIVVDTRLEPAIWTVAIDPGQLENALMNLILNSRDALPEGGRIAITTANATLDETASQQLHLSIGDHVTLSVEDSGSGMAPEVLNRVFEPFFTTKDVGAGSGLGLSMVYGFIKQSGGQVHIVSRPGHGTTITLYLPRASTAGNPAAPQPETAGHRGVNTGEHTVLVVEDDAGVRRTTVDMLQNIGYRTREAASGREALDRLDADDAIDLLLTDVVLSGGMSGAELTGAARRSRPELQVLYCSGYTRDELIEGGYLGAVIEFLPKPFRTADLAARLETIFGREQLTAASPGHPDNSPLHARS